MTNEIQLFMNYSADMQLDAATFKDVSFSFVTIFEYLYPISTFCNSARGEVATDTMERLDLMIRNPDLIVRNVLYKLGSISLNLMTVEDCFNNTLDGKCAG